MFWGPLLVAGTGIEKRQRIHVAAPGEGKVKEIRLARIKWKLHLTSLAFMSAASLTGSYYHEAITKKRVSFLMHEQHVTVYDRMVHYSCCGNKLPPLPANNKKYSIVQDLIFFISLQAEVSLSRMLVLTAK